MRRRLPPAQGRLERADSGRESVDDVAQSAPNISDPASTFISSNVRFPNIRQLNSALALLVQHLGVATLKALFFTSTGTAP